MPDRSPSRARLDALERRGLRMLRPGQILLALGLVGLLSVLIATSFVSVSAHDRELDGLFSEEADGTAMTFVQRESFGVVLELDQWTHGAATARDVQIARALLGQRLQVVTNSGSSTYDLAEEPYQEALAALDEVIRGLDEVPDDERAAARLAMEPVTGAFESEARELSAIFQRITRDSAVQAIETRAAVEQLQAGVATLIVLLGVGLAVWLAADLRATYRLASLRLRAETRRLAAARRSLEFREQLQALGRDWAEALAGALPFEDMADRVRDDLQRILPHVRLAVAPDGDAARVEVAGLRREPGRAAPLSRADVAAALSRANETLRLTRQRDALQEQWSFERQHDPLTGLPNRERLVPTIAESRRAAASRPGAVLALALVDLDRFADFNSSFGHAAGDRLLVDVAARLSELCADGRTVLRLSADEFAVVGLAASEEEALEQVAALADDMVFPYEVAGGTTSVAVTVGAVVVGDEELSVDAIIQRAAAALASAQQAEPRIPLRLFVAERDEHLLAIMHEESALRSALRSGEFEMHFQPIIELASGRLAACEALVRWNRPGVGLLPPGAFLPAVERAGLSVELGWQVIDLTLTAWAELRAAAEGALDDARLSINVEAAQLRESNLADYLVNAAERTGVPLDRLVVEVTEHALLIGDGPVSRLAALRERGLRVALDDFGTGYSSLSVLQSLQVDFLKIDRSFVETVATGAVISEVVPHIIDMGKSLGLRMIAEGVETSDQADYLRQRGVQFAQGWLFGRPVVIDELVAQIGTRCRA